MFQYQVRVATGTYVDSGTTDWISLTLVGTAGESPKTLLDSWIKDFYFGADTTYKVTSKQDLGDILLIRLHKKKSLVLSDSWYCNFIKVTSPEGKAYNFPIYSWIEGSDTFEFREGTGKPSAPLPPKKAPSHLLGSKREWPMALEVSMLIYRAWELIKMNS
ncbi:arachidonate 12-lipoxygenase, 12R-type-like [Sceloporus undulatus]|uniref:arachidonate 12-lipoxygenase, 12R-type-like n=1 Tax=Sceloporus undulatus TaxID=8520 RepID=UPI001C4AAB37|nr:arachidonate 12-lipoxygenase, 12R-type-like [Sceloporus undulatus]